MPSMRNSYRVQNRRQIIKGMFSTTKNLNVYSNDSKTMPARFIAFLMFINIISGENTQWYKHTCYKITNQKQRSQ